MRAGSSLPLILIPRKTFANKATQTNLQYNNQTSAVAVRSYDETDALAEQLETVMALSKDSDVEKEEQLLQNEIKRVLAMAEWPAHEVVNLYSWNPTEISNLQIIAASKIMKDWQAVAEALKTGRTAYQCYCFNRTQLLQRPENEPEWTDSEITILNSVTGLFQQNGVTQWGRVASALLTRTKMECYLKHHDLHEIARFGNYLEEEDAVIYNFVNMFGPCFEELGFILVGRSTYEIAMRHRMLLRLQELSTWTIRDDIKLLYIRKTYPLTIGTTFEHFKDYAIQQNIASFPGKDAESLIERLDLLERWTALNPDVSWNTNTHRLTDALRRNEWASLKPKQAHIAQSLAELKVRLRLELLSYQEAKYDQEVNNKKKERTPQLETTDRCPLNN